MPAGRRAGMRCYTSRGGLSDLLLLNQPVIMRLYSADGREYSATLVSLDAQVATLVDRRRRASGAGVRTRQFLDRTLHA